MQADASEAGAAASRPFRLAFVDLTTAAPEEALRYYAEDLGATITAEVDGRTTYLSLGCDHHNLALLRGREPGLEVVGLQVAPTTFDGLERRLRDAGLPVAVKGDARPGVPALIEVGPVGGHRFQLFTSMSEPAPGFARSGVVPNRLGHVALMSPKATELVAFLTGPLGFAVTDRFEEAVTFLTCNRDHHVINVVAAPVSKLHHLAFELRGKGHQFDAVDFLARRDRPTLWGPSRHTAGHNLASYHYGPERTLIELYTEMDVFISETGTFEPRPWHESLPLRPQTWPLSQMCAWGTPFAFDFRTA